VSPEPAAPMDDLRRPPPLPSGMAWEIQGFSLEEARFGPSLQSVQWHQRDAIQTAWASLVVGIGLGGLGLLLALTGDGSAWWLVVTAPVVGAALGWFVLRQWRVRDPVVGVEPLTVLDFVGERVLGGSGGAMTEGQHPGTPELWGAFGELELGIHWRALRNDFLEDISIDVAARSGDLYLSVVRDGYDHRLLVGPAPLDQLEAFAWYLLRLYPFRRLRLRNQFVHADGSPRHPQGYSVEADVRAQYRQQAGLPPSPTDNERP